MKIVTTIVLGIGSATVHAVDHRNALISAEGDVTLNYPPFDAIQSKQEVHAGRTFSGDGFFISLDTNDARLRQTTTKKRNLEPRRDLHSIHHDPGIGDHETCTTRWDCACDGNTGLGTKSSIELVPDLGNSGHGTTHTSNSVDVPLFHTPVSHESSSSSSSSNDGAPSAGGNMYGEVGDAIILPLGMRFNYEVSGFGKSECVNCDVAIYDGKSCRDDSLIGSVYWNRDLYPENPWNSELVGYSTTNAGTGEGFFTIRTGLGFDDYNGRVVIFKGSSGLPIACGELSESNSSQSLIAQLVDHPDFVYIPEDWNIEGVVRLDFETPQPFPREEIQLDIYYNVSGFGDLNCVDCGIHIYEGDTCDNAFEVGDHYWNEEIYPNDPFNEPTSSTYTVINGYGSGYTHVVIGYYLGKIAGHTVVFHDAAGTHIACGVLLPVSNDRLSAIVDNYPSYVSSISNWNPKGTVSAENTIIAYRRKLHETNHDPLNHNHLETPPHTHQSGEEYGLLAMSSMHKNIWLGSGGLATICTCYCMVDESLPVFSLAVNDFVSNVPSSSPSTSPTTNPTSVSTDIPSSKPSISPTDNPSTSPTDNPSVSPTEEPTSNPTNFPSFNPSTLPSAGPTTFPSLLPTVWPIGNPSSKPSIKSIELIAGENVDISAIVSVAPSSSSARVKCGNNRKLSSPYKSSSSESEISYSSSDSSSSESQSQSHSHSHSSHDSSSSEDESDESADWIPIDATNDDDSCCAWVCGASPRIIDDPGRRTNDRDLNSSSNTQYCIWMCGPSEDGYLIVS